ncbi:uncharacterized protein LOC110833219 isoform X2 [Zootermopsis nevadensis]|uniref:uncharacterized protein LOC110833219 isoform X2 n=1 Tax=Zootermopsis nevadensis TaxID=136037 RepID=UPI000B8E3208|nr:uncharacterized protein LOC110833219 isoform X2 [Zootermopsis nevadensis]
MLQMLSTGDLTIHWLPDCVHFSCFACITLRLHQENEYHLRSKADSTGRGFGCVVLHRCVGIRFYFFGRTAAAAGSWHSQVTSATMDWKGYVVVITALLSYKDANCLRLNEVRIPMHTVRDLNARLECHFDLEGEALYSVKWYKDGNEFFRFVPRDQPPAQLFPLPGVSVDIHNSTESQVVLKSVNLSSTGRYRCEVSAEAPSFQTVSDHGDMTVVALPEEGPRITGGRPRYQIGDTVRVNCTSGRSKPAAQLMWFINGEQADSTFLQGPEIVYTGREGLETAILGLEFRVKPKHFRRGDMKLKCLATIATVYWRSNEESVEGDKPQKAPVLESRETVPPSKSRADRVQATGSCATLLSCAPLLAVCGFIVLVTTLLSTAPATLSSR